MTENSTEGKVGHQERSFYSIVGVFWDSRVIKKDTVAKEGIIS